jgi:hypothetical protein
MTFYGRVVDQDGLALKGAHVVYRIESYPADWTFKTRGRDNIVSQISATSNDQGSFQFTFTGCKLIRLKVTRVGYRHFYEADLSDGAPQTKGYTIVAWSDLWYKSDPNHPALYVFVKDGVHAVSALPCRGGYDSGGGNRWTLNKPAWPHKPSLPDVHYVPPSLRPTTQEK